MSYTKQSFPLFYGSNLSGLNFRFLLFMYPGSLGGGEPRGAALLSYKTGGQAKSNFVHCCYRRGGTGPFTNLTIRAFLADQTLNDGWAGCRDFSKRESRVDPEGNGPQNAMRVCFALSKRLNKYKNKHKYLNSVISFFSKSVEKVENGGRLGPLGQNFPQTGPLDPPLAWMPPAGGMVLP